MTHLLEYDWTGLMANAVPGAIAADILMPGSSKAQFVAAAATASLTQLVQLRTDGADQALRLVYHNAPMLGFGAGYGVARIGNQDMLTSLVVGALAGALVFSFARSKHLLARQAETLTAVSQAVPAYSAVDPSGAPPPAAGASWPFGA